jgi:hypothetical protein
VGVRRLPARYRHGAKGLAPSRDWTDYCLRILEGANPLAPCPYPKPVQTAQLRSSQFRRTLKVKGYPVLVPRPLSADIFLVFSVRRVHFPLVYS